MGLLLCPPLHALLWYDWCCLEATLVLEMRWVDHFVQLLEMQQNLLFCSALACFCAAYYLQLLARIGTKVRTSNCHLLIS